MGVSGSRNQGSTERQPRGERSAQRYRYPPEDGGNYFSSHYYLGHRKFECGDPELFLFGELADLNYLPSKPTSFPYKQPNKSQPVGCLRSYINIQRESVKLVRSTERRSDYRIEFTFDSDVDCKFTILTGLSDTAQFSKLPHGISDESEVVSVSRTFEYSSGSDQVFKQTGFTVSPTEMDEDKLTYDPENDNHHFPIVILMQSREDREPVVKQSQMTICSLDEVNSSGYSIKVLKQKLLVDGVEYLLQEVYGLENKSHTNEEGDSDDRDSDIEEDLGAECVICITDVRDTILLPCRHLCLCNTCAGNLRYQSSNCPICRAPFRALLQIQALEPLNPDTVLDDDEATGNPKYSVPGYQCIPLLQALNGYSLEESEEDIDTGPEPETVDNKQTTPPATPPPAAPQPERDYCVVPIEDETLETDNVSPIPENPPSVTNKSNPSSRREVYEVGVECVPLPGTPTNDQHHVSISLSGEERQDEGKVCIDGINCGSSVSSETSTKSTDMLLPTT